MIICIPALLVALAVVSLFFPEKPVFKEHSAGEPWLPASASDICFYSSRDFEAYEFTISEEEFRRFAQKKTWDVEEVSAPRSVVRYLEATQWMETEKGKVPLSQMHASVGKGLWYEQRKANGGGISVAYDRDAERAFVDWSSH